MRTATATTLLVALATFVTASPNPVLESRDIYGKCPTFGANCATQEQQFCDPTTGKISVCHQFNGGHCWIRFTQVACPATPAPTTKRSEPVANISKRDEYGDCSSFGDKCAVDDNVFCEGGWTRICHHLPFTRGKCWISYGLLDC